MLVATETETETLWHLPFKQVYVTIQFILHSSLVCPSQARQKYKSSHFIPQSDIILTVGQCYLCVVHLQCNTLVIRPCHHQDTHRIICILILIECVDTVSVSPFKTEERLLGWQCCTESTTTSLPLMELRTSSNHHPHANDEDTTSSSRSHTAEPSTSSTHSCREPSETGVTCPRKSLRSRPSTHLCELKGLQTAVIPNINYFILFFCAADPP